MALQLDEPIEHPFDFAEGEVEARSGVREADRAVEVAGGVHLDEGEAGVLAVLRTEPAVEWTAAVDLGGDPGRGLAGLVVTGLADVCLRIGVDEAFEPAVVGTALAQVHLLVAQEDLGVDGASAFRTDRAGDLVQDLPRGAGLRGARRVAGGHCDLRDGFDPATLPRSIARPPCPGSQRRRG